MNNIPNGVLEKDWQGLNEYVRLTYFDGAMGTQEDAEIVRENIMEQSKSQGKPAVRDQRTCKLHANLNLRFEFFCQNCKMLFCPVCLKDHQGHITIHLSEKANHMFENENNIHKYYDDCKKFTSAIDAIQQEYIDMKRGK